LDEVALARFHRVYRRTFGHASTDEAVEVVALRMSAVGLMRRSAHTTPTLTGSGEPYLEQDVWFRDRRVPTKRFRREDLRAGQRVNGPVVIDEASCTTVVPEDWVLEVDDTGVMAVTR
jgi:N-methylhydantoinase A